MTQMFTDRRECREWQSSLSQPRLHLCESCSPSVDKRSRLTSPVQLEEIESYDYDRVADFPLHHEFRYLDPGH
jgi:hypothetical protein